MLAKEYFTNQRYNYYCNNNYNQENSSKSVFDIILRLANEGKIDSVELKTLLSFYAALFIEKEVESKIENFISYDLNKFFRKRFLND